jgi:VWFA-related protein
VRNLDPANFELSQGGQTLKLSSLTWFDTRQHTATSVLKPPTATSHEEAGRGSAAPAQPKFELAPADICRNFVLVVDDLDLAPESATRVQKVVRDFVRGTLAPDDRAVILRTSSGNGWQEELTADRRALDPQIERIHAIGQGMPATSVGSAVWQGVRWAAGGLRPVPGRKSVVLISSHLDAPVLTQANTESLRSSALAAANNGMMVFYTVSAGGVEHPPAGSALAGLVRETGGLSVTNLDAVARDQEGYYVLGFHPAQEAGSSTPPLLQLHNEVAKLRWRFGFLTLAEPRIALLPADRFNAAQLHPAMGTAGQIHVRLTPVITGFDAQGASVDLLAHLDGRDLSDFRDVKGKHQFGVELQIAAYSDYGKVTSLPPRQFQVSLDDAQAPQAREQGFIYATRLHVASPAGYQIRIVVADNLSDRVGEAMQFLDVPDASHGQFVASGLVLKDGSPSKLPAETLSLVPEPAALRRFQPGNPLPFSYGVFNTTLGPEKESRLRVATKVYAGGRRVFAGQPIELSFPPSGGGTLRRVTGKVQLDQNISPGDYVIEVEVTDLLAKDPTHRTVTQYSTFEVRE